MIKIYKLTFKDEVVYIGQTKRKLYKRKCNGYDNIPFYKECKIELIEETDDESRERYWIKFYLDLGAPLLNIRLGNGFDTKEYNKNYREKNKGYYVNYLRDYSKKYYEENKEKVLESIKNYKKENKENIIKYSKDYYEENKEKMNDYAKKYNEENKERLKEYRREYYKNKRENKIKNIQK